jgi:hypothetical protein
MDDKLVPFTMTLDNTDLEILDFEDPEFDWQINPDFGQMSVNLLLTTLDQTRDEDTAEVTPPRGISSLNSLSILSATFHSTSGKFSSLVMECDIPEFNFLPLELASSNNECIISYSDSSTVKVVISGEVTLADDSAFDAKFVKSYDQEYYVITLEAQTGSPLSFSTIKSQIFETISTQTTNILPNDENSLNKLAQVDITEDDVEISDSRIIFRLDSGIEYIDVYGTIEGSNTENGKIQTSLLL